MISDMPFRSPIVDTTVSTIFNVFQHTEGSKGNKIINLHAFCILDRQRQKVPKNTMEVGDISHYPFPKQQTKKRCHSEVPLRCFIQERKKDFYFVCMPTRLSERRILFCLNSAVGFEVLQWWRNGTAPRRLSFYFWRDISRQVAATSNSRSLTASINVLSVW